MHEKKWKSIFIKLKIVYIAKVEHTNTLKFCNPKKGKSR